MRILNAIIFLFLILTSCAKDLTDPDNLITGIWNYSGSENEVMVFTRNDKFTDNHCYRFSGDGSMLERKNSGFCGTPPIVYADYEGTWSKLTDSLIKVDVGFWGGQTNYQLEIVDVSESTLKVIPIYPQ